VSLLEPSFVLAGRNANLTVNGWYSLELLDYARKKQPNSVSPSGSLEAQYAFVPEQVFLAGSVASSRVVDTPFDANPSVTAGLPSSDLSRVRLSPFLTSEPNARLRYLLRADGEWIHERSLTNAPPNTIATRQRAEVERLPVPFGLSLVGERESTRIQSASQGGLTDEIVRATARYTIDTTLTVGARGGYVHNNFAVDRRDRNSSVAGAELHWRPTDSAGLSAFGERRDFGTAWQAAFYHHGPHLAMDLTSSRKVTTGPQSMFELNTSGSFATLLDEVYGSRYPNPLDRLRAVADALANASLTPTIGLPIAVYMTVPIRLSVHQLSVAALQPRNVAVVSVYENRSEALPSQLTAIGSIHPFSYNLTGATLNDTYRLTPLGALTARFDWSRTRGFNADRGQRTTQNIWQLQWVQQLSRNLYTLIGTRFRSLSSSNRLGQEFESAILAGVGYRFR